ncbi:MAG: flagellar motor switch protein FliM [Mycobacteriales bacterium]
MAATSTTDIAAEHAAVDSPAPPSGKRARRKSGPQPFDFRRPSKFSRDHARALQIVNETFARQFTTILSTTLRSVSQVSVASIDHVSYDEYIRSSPDPTLMAILNVDPLPGAGILQLPLGIAMAAIDRLLGGNGDGNQPARALTDIESVLMRELLVRVLHELDYAFESLAKVKTSIVQLEFNPQFAQVAAPSDMVVVATFDVRIGGKEAPATLCLPFTALQPVLEQVTGHALFADRKGTDPVESARAITAGLSGVPVDVAVRFDPVTLTSSEILHLRVGDVLPLRHPVSAPLSVCAADSTCAFAVPGSKGRRLAFMIVDSNNDKDSRP